MTAAQGQGQAPGQGQGQGQARLRTFVAVPLPAAVRTAILDAAQSLSEQLPAVRWARKAENLHITLKFLGQVDGALVDRFASALTEALGSSPGFEIGLRGFGAFPSMRDAQVIWLGVDDPSRRLGEVAAVVEQVARRIGLAVAEEAAGRRVFRAHVTVGRTARRARHGVDAQSALAPWSDRPFGNVRVREIHVYESITGGEASIYVLRGTAMLQQS